MRRLAAVGLVVAVAVAVALVLEARRDDDPPGWVVRAAHRYMSEQLGMGFPDRVMYRQTTNAVLAVYEYSRPTTCGGCLTRTGELPLGWASAAPFDPRTHRPRRFAVCNSLIDCELRLGLRDPGGAERGRELEAISAALGDDAVSIARGLLPRRPAARDCSVFSGPPGVRWRGVCGTTVELRDDGSARVTFAQLIEGVHLWRYDVTRNGRVRLLEHPTGALPQQYR